MRIKRGIAAVLVAGMAVFGVGCSGAPLTKDQQQGIGNFIFMVIYMGMCQANNGVCPFPLGPSDPLVTEAPTALPAPPSLDLATAPG